MDAKKDIHSRGTFNKIEKRLQDNTEYFVTKRVKFENVNQNKMAKDFVIKTLNKFDPLLIQNGDETDNECEIKNEKGECVK